MRFLFLLLTLVQAVAIQAQTAAPKQDELAALLKDAQMNGRNAGLMSEYTYNWKISQRDKQGKSGFREKFDMYETYVPTLKVKGTTKWVLVQTHENSQPKTPAELASARKKAGEKLQKAEDESQRVNADPASSSNAGSRLPGIYFDAVVGFGFGKNVKLSLQTLLSECPFELTGEDTLHDRPMLKLDFRPATLAKLNKDESFLARSQGTVWIDKADRLVVKVEGWPINTERKPENLAFAYQSARMPQGKWVPQLIQFLGIKNRDYFNGLKGDMIFEWLDYKHFRTEAEDAKIKTPQ